MVLVVGTIGLLLMRGLRRKGKRNQLRLCVTKILVLAKYRFVTISFPAVSQGSLR
jgi:O-acetyl-ADP-ribose deacetylase (regulator of RNase III)